MPVPVRIAGELEIRLEDLSQQAFEQIKSALTFLNEDKIKALERKEFGAWDLPDTVELYRIEQRRGGDHVLLLPRGFAAGLVAGLASMGQEIAWDDQRTASPAAEGYYRPFLLRSYQLEAALAMMRFGQGFYECPAGGGKTVTILGMLAYLNQRALIIVDKSNLLEQWRTRAAQFYDMPMTVDKNGKPTASLEGSRTVGKIGQDVWEERDLTIALRQTLHSRAWENKATGWWKTWGVVGFDEGHHLGSETLGDIARSVEAPVMLAVSATPSKSDTHAKIVHALVGPVIHRTPREVLYAEQVLMRPQIFIHPTSFEAVFWGDHDSDAGGNCEVPDCPKTRKHHHQNNYQSVLKALVEDEARNALIASKIVSERGVVHLVPSRQKKHLDLLKKACIAAGWPKDKIWMLRGKENAEGLSEEIAQQLAETDEGILFSTVADEGLDVPPIARVHMVFPGRLELATIQVIGRGERIWPGKTDSIVRDYVDSSAPFSDQAAERETTYRKLGHRVHLIDSAPQVFACSS